MRLQIDGADDITIDDAGRVRLTIEEALDVTRIYSVADQLSSDEPLVRHRPFRAPHHTVSYAGLITGGRWPKPGEISLAPGGRHVVEPCSLAAENHRVITFPCQRHPARGDVC